MSTTGECQSCGAPTEIISRRIGFFGLAETYCTHCRDCLGAAAKEQGLDPEAVLTEYDERIAAIAAGRASYQARKERKARSNSRKNTGEK